MAARESREQQARNLVEKQRDEENIRIVARVTVYLEQQNFEKAVDACSIEELEQLEKVTEVLQTYIVLSHCLEVRPTRNQTYYMLRLLEGHFGMRIFKVMQELQFLKADTQEYICPYCPTVVSTSIHDLISHGQNHFRFLPNFNLKPYSCSSAICKGENFNLAYDLQQHLLKPNEYHNLKRTHEALEALAKNGF